MTVWHCHVAMTLDGKIARQDGGIDWLVEDYQPEGLGFEEFYKGVSAIVMGRSTYEACLGAETWPYADKDTYVLTSRRLDPPHPRIHVRNGTLSNLVSELEDAGLEKVWIEGGGQVVRGMIELGKLDILELALIPIILGPGIPLFPEGTTAWSGLLETGRVWQKGAMHLKYRRRPETSVANTPSEPH